MTEVFKINLSDNSEEFIGFFSNREFAIEMCKVDYSSIGNFMLYVK